MIQYVKGNLLKADVEAIVNTVNCVGVMGKGIALQFKQAFPDNFNAYKKACKQQDVVTGKMHLFNTGNLVNPRFIVNFPTKKHWRGKSQMAFVEAGLVDLKKIINTNNIRSIAIPPLGCGNGGLNWLEVERLIENELSDLKDVSVLVYSPNDALAPDEMPVATSKPNMTQSRALFVKLIELYSKPDYRLSLLEIQKLAYFLQVAGEPLRLNYQKHHYGPYAENLNHVLQRIEGHFIRGYGDRSKDAQIYLLDNAVEQAEAFLAEDAEATQRLKRVARLIEGYETPYGMELLATIHWLLHSGTPIHKLTLAVNNWSARKAKLMQAKHIEKATQRLQAQAWA